MHRRRFIKDYVLNHDQELIFSAAKFSTQRELARLNDYALAYHIPKFFLRNPIFKIVIRGYPRVFFSGRHNCEANLLMNLCLLSTHKLSHFTSQRKSLGAQASCLPRERV